MYYMGNENFLILCSGIQFFCKVRLFYRVCLKTTFTNLRTNDEEITIYKSIALRTETSFMQ